VLTTAPNRHLSPFTLIFLPGILIFQDQESVREQVSVGDGVGKLSVCPVVDWNAVVVDEMEEPVEVIAKFGDVQLWTADD